jgi:competence protein ComEC
MDSEREAPPPFKSPLLVVASSFALGILLVHPEHARAAEIIPEASLLLAAAGACLLTGIGLLRAGWPKISGLLALTGFVIAGSTSSLLFEGRFPPNHVRHLATSGIDLADPIRLEGVLISTPLRTPYGLQFDIQATRVEGDRPEAGGTTHPVTGKVRLRLETSSDPAAWSQIESMRLQYGDSIRALARLRRPKSYRNPGSFNFRGWMESIEDICWDGTIKNPLLLEKLPRRGGPGVGNLISSIRQRLINAIDELYPPWSRDERYGAVLKAVLLGERASLDSATIESFRASGLYHLLVIAGLHLGLLALIANFLLRRLPLGATARSIALLVFLGGYAALVEQRSSTLRATLMILAYLVARLLYRERVLLNAIGLAALVLLVQRPAWLFESGFQLSFSAVLLIAGLAVPILIRTIEPYRRALWQIDEVGRDIRFTPHQAQFRLDVRPLINALTSRIGFMERHPTLASSMVTGTIRMALWTANILLFSAILQIGLFLPMAETFHRVTIAGIGLNAVAIPLMVTLLICAVPTVLLAVLSPSLAFWPSRAVALVLKGIFALTAFPSLAHWLSFRVAEPPTWVALGFALSAVVAGFALRRWFRVAWISLAAMALFAMLISLHPFAPRLPRGVLEVTALDCGGGDAVFVVLPDQTTLLLDAGGSRTRNTREGTSPGRRWDPGEDIVSPYLWSRGIQEIDILALSNLRDDHLGGVAAVIRNFRVGELWRGENSFTPAYQELMETARRRVTPIREMAAGEVLTRGTTSILILGPPRQNDMISAPNSTSGDPLVLRISDHTASVLLPGDFSAKVEHELLSSTFPLESEVLKLAPEGSKISSSPEFLGRVSPRVALVSADNDGGRVPTPAALARLQAVGARVYRTDVSGAVTVAMLDGSIAVQTFGASPED